MTEKLARIQIGDPCRLIDCPPGLFHDGDGAYGCKESGGSWACSGSAANRASDIVWPVKVLDVPAVEVVGEVR